MELASDIPNDISGTGGTTRYIHVLRSDRTVLRSSSFPNHPGGSYDRKRSGYRAIGKISESAPDLIASFEAYHARFITRISG